ncbi:hypothetical protein E2C01_012838 [Portunus trituberculatus]|uniref:Uncharacterized protein n=1 Tax=Portunus trituberculatus TaxID=210409 RepID=A0A5B7DF30_PORTR|nr:hypothetical protein [Portunus trituberculatus]
MGTATSMAWQPLAASLFSYVLMGSTALATLLNVGKPTTGLKRPPTAPNIKAFSDFLFMSE